MAKGKTQKQSLIGSIGGLLIGAAILFFVVTIIFGQIQTINVYGDASNPPDTVTLDNTYWHNATTTNISRNGSFSYAISNLHQTDTTFSIYNENTTANIVYNLTVNGVLIKDTVVLVNLTWQNTTLATMIAGGVSDTDTYLNCTFNVSTNENDIKIRHYRTDPVNHGGVQVRADWNDSNATVDTLLVFCTISVILLGVMGITMVGASIIGYISGAF